MYIYIYIYTFLYYFHICFVRPGQECVWHLHPIRVRIRTIKNPGLGNSGASLSWRETRPYKIRIDLGWSPELLDSYLVTWRHVYIHICWEIYCLCLICTSLHLSYVALWLRPIRAVRIWTTENPVSNKSGTSLRFVCAVCSKNTIDM